MRRQNMDNKYAQDRMPEAHDAGAVAAEGEHRPAVEPDLIRGGVGRCQECSAKHGQQPLELGRAAEAVVNFIPPGAAQPDEFRVSEQGLQGMTKAKEPETLLGSHNLLPLGAGVLEEARRVAQRARVVCMAVPLLLRRPGVPAAPRYAHEQRPMLEAEHTRNADSPETLRICTSTKQCLDKVHMLLS